MNDFKHDNRYIILFFADWKFGPKSPPRLGILLDQVLIKSGHQFANGQMNGPRRPKLALAIKVQSTSDTKDGAGNECILSPDVYSRLSSVVDRMSDCQCWLNTQLRGHFYSRILTRYTQNNIERLNNLHNPISCNANNEEEMFDA